MFAAALGYNFISVCLLILFILLFTMLLLTVGSQRIEFAMFISRDSTMPFAQRIANPDIFKGQFMKGYNNFPASGLDHYYHDSEKTG